MLRVVGCLAVLSICYSTACYFGSKQAGNNVNVHSSEGMQLQDSLREQVKWLWFPPHPPHECAGALLHKLLRPHPVRVVLNGCALWDTLEDHWCGYVNT
eukprot:3689323-Amphidinium_carterae.1